MGLGGSAWIKQLLRYDPQFNQVMHYSSDSPARRHEKPKDKPKGIEAGFDVVMVELMLRKHALVKGCQNLRMLSKRWCALAAGQMLRFPDVETMIFMFDDETNVPQAKGETQRKRRKAAGGATSGFTAEEQVLLGPYKYLCNADPKGFDQRIRELFGHAALLRKRQGRTTVSPFEIFLGKHMRTRGLRKDEFEFATRCIVAGAYGILAASVPDEEGPVRPKERRIIVDRGVWRNSFSRDLEQDAHGGGQEPWESIVESFADAADERMVYHCRTEGQAIDDLNEQYETITVTVPATGTSIGERVHTRVKNTANNDLVAKRAYAMAVYAKKAVQTATNGYEQHFFLELQDLQKELDQCRGDAYRGQTTPQSGPSCGGLSTKTNHVGTVVHARHVIKLANDILQTAAAEMGIDDLSEGAEDSASMAWIHIDRWGVRKIEAMDGCHLIGEADLKIPRYARLFAGRNVYVVCHDTDLLPILLLTAKDWIPKQGKFTGRLWLDMTTPTDHHPKLPKKRPKSAPDLMLDKDGTMLPLKGVVDILGLWRCLHLWFAKEFRGIQNPVEVFCLLTICMGTDYLNNPPGLGPVKLWGGFKAKQLCNLLNEVLMTDGHMGDALPTDDTMVALQKPPLGSLNAKTTTELLVRILQRTPTGAAFFDAKQPEKGLESCPPVNRRRHLDINEPKLVQFLMNLYKAYIKNPDKWPTSDWFRSQARRLRWQMVYWYAGDTFEGRQHEDEMSMTLIAGKDKDVPPISLHGWEWVQDPDVSAVPGSISAVFNHRKRKAGCLNRRKPAGMYSAPATKVLPFLAFQDRLQQQQQQQQPHKKQKTKTKTDTSGLIVVVPDK